MVDEQADHIKEPSKPGDDKDNMECFKNTGEMVVHKGLEGDNAQGQ